MLKVWLVSFLLYLCTIKIKLIKKKKMENFKTVNKNTNATYFLNEEELINFFKKNSVQNYSITNLTKQKRTRTNKMLDVVVHFCIIGASILSTLLYIQNYC